MKCFIVLMMVCLLAIAGRAHDGLAEETKKDMIKLFNVEKNTYEEVPKIDRDENELRSQLTSQQFHITQEAGTERAFTGKLLNNKKKGVYQCIVCGTDLFSSETKYESGTGWPSFWQPVAKENVGEKADNSLFMRRIEVHCPRCESHLGHVFDDGPAPTHKRFCINSAALKFQSNEKSD